MRCCGPLRARVAYWCMEDNDDLTLEGWMELFIIHSMEWLL